MPKTNNTLAVGEQRDGVWRRNKNTYMVRIMVDGRRQHINAGDNYEAAKLLALEAKKRKAQERLTGHNTLVADLLKPKSNLTTGELVNLYIETRVPIRKHLTIRFYKGIVSHFESISVKKVECQNNKSCSHSWQSRVQLWHKRKVDRL